jgi:protein ImuA
MAMKAVAQAELGRLRRDIARIEGRLTERLALDSTPPSSADAGENGTHERRQLKFGIASLDSVLGGGLPLGTLHEVRAVESRESGAATGFLTALLTCLAEAGAPAFLWISEAETRRETGCLYAPGLIQLGLDPARIIEVPVRTQDEALWAFETALSCSGLGGVVCELRQASLDLSATRRCVLRAREAGVTGFLLRLGSHVEPSAAELRFRLSSLPAGTIGEFSVGVGRMAWRLALEKNRGGPTGLFTLEWNAYERSFVERGEGHARARPQPLSAASPDRPAYPRRTESGPNFKRAS